MLIILIGQVKLAPDVIDFSAHIDADAEDTASINQTFSEKPEHRVVDLSSRWHDKSGYHQQGTYGKHDDGGQYLYGFFVLSFHGFCDFLK